MDSNVHVRREKNPRENASWFSILICLFGFKTFKKGLRRDLQERDIYRIVESFSSEKLGNRLEEEWNKELKKKRPLIARSLFKVYWLDLLLLGTFIMVIETGNMVVTPVLTGKLVSYFTPNQTEMTFNDALICTTKLLAATVGMYLFDHLYTLFTAEAGYKIKVCISTLVYRKCLRLTTNSLSKYGNGFIITLITRDVMLFNEITDGLIVIAEGTFQYILFTYLIYAEVGVAGVIAASLIFIILPLQVYLGKKISDYRLKTVVKTDDRVRITQEILTAMRIIKMYTWEPFFNKLVSILRKKEIRNLRLLFYIKVLVYSVGQLTSRVALYICIVTYVALGNHITPEKAFIVTGCFVALRWVLTDALPQAVTKLSECKITVDRITNFLLLEEAFDYGSIDHELPKVSLNNVTVNLGKDASLLKGITLELTRGLTVVTGPVGSGKSNLLKLILGDFQKSTGSMDVEGRLSYASQEPWIFPGTVKQNIIFGQPFDQTRYENVIRVCALKQDFEVLPNGDRTHVVDRGLNLSRGQKARVNLARAVYRVADVYLLDDCLSAVDARVGRFIFKECITRFLKDSICVLVTHQRQCLRQADQIFVLNDGYMEFQGNYSLFKDWDNEELKLVLKEKEQMTNYDEKVPGDEKIGSNYEISDETSTLLDADSKINRNIYEETKAEGAVAKDVYFRYFKLGGGFIIAIVVIAIAILAQISLNWSDYFVSYWVDMEQEMSDFRHNQTTNSTEYKKLKDSYSDVMMLYSFVILAATIFALLRAFSFLIFSSRASTRVHKLMLQRILNAGMVFFDQHLSGNVINRFSRDLNIIDEQVPFVGMDILIIILELFGALFVVTSVNLYFIVPSIILVVLLYLGQYFYLPTGRSLKRLEGVTRSPMIGHINATLEGLNTIRASQMDTTLRNEYYEHQDLYNSAVYMSLATGRAFAYLVTILSNLYLAVISYTFILISNDALAGQVGLAITQSLSLTRMLTRGVTQWAMLETLMTSAERVLEYTEIEGEDKSGKKINEWPKGGKIEYQDVNLRYSPTSERVLKDIKFVIQPREKIGLVGRTGAGKSSVISTLFRMYDYQGTITIDDINTTEVDVELLRSKISIIPQDPVLFSGTIRSNLDPNCEYSDNVLWDALEEVEMKKTVGSLNTTITEGDSLFSIGQKQLLSLARAIIRNNVVLVLDEATANIDPQTDSLIQRTIRKKFSDCTVITIAHRLHTIMDSNKVLVMDSGVVVEYDNPKILIAKRGWFYDMVKEAGLL